jgi:uncharacterized small protein (DUF1192 family)
MYPQHQNSPGYLIKEVHDLEDAYAEALGDEADVRTLSLLWQRIKLLNEEIERQRQEERYSCNR